MSSKGKKTQGMKLYIGTSADDHATDTYVQIKRVDSITPPGPKANVIDITALDDAAHEKLKGLVDFGECAFAYKIVPSDAGQIAFRAAAVSNSDELINFKIDFADPLTVGVGPHTPTLVYFKGLAISNPSDAHNVNGVREGKGAIAVSGALIEVAAT